jgi:hypothetical protein
MLAYLSANSEAVCAGGYPLEDRNVYAVFAVRKELPTCIEITL